MNSKGSLKISFDPNGIPFPRFKRSRTQFSSEKKLTSFDSKFRFHPTFIQQNQKFPPKKISFFKLMYQRNDARKKSSSRNYFKFNSKKRHCSPNTYATKIQTSSNIFDRTKNLGNLFQKKITNISLILDP